MKKPNSYFLGEGLLIVFSILAALGVNEWRIRAGETAALKDAVADLSVEIADNLELLEGVPDYQRDVAKSLREIAEKSANEGAGIQQTPMELIGPMIEDIGRTRNNAIGIDGPLQAVSWHTAKDRKVIAQLDYESAKALAAAYDTQIPQLSRYYFQIADVLTGANMYIARDQRATLLAVAAMYTESAGRSQYLITLLEDAQTALQEKHSGEARRSTE